MPLTPAFSSRPAVFAAFALARRPRRSPRRRRSAGTVYVPLPGVTNVGTPTWDAELTIANASPSRCTSAALLLAHDTDGTLRAGLTPAVLNVGAAQTLIGTARRHLSSASLELAGSPNARYAARPSPARAALGRWASQLPVISSSKRRRPAAARLSLQGSPPTRHAVDDARARSTSRTPRASARSRC
jgi:hypothetical protein